jgi:hypoxanthine-DNA glycosylase
MELVIHPWLPVFDSMSKVLILGTIPSPKSREAGFYYGHPQNCFWKVLSLVTGDKEPFDTIYAKTNFLLRNRIALWDVLHSCEIKSACDNSIRNPVVNKFCQLVEKTEINAIFTTGRKATALFQKFCAYEVSMNAIYLPSTSPANRAQINKPIFMEAWAKLKQYL